MFDNSYLGFVLNMSTTFFNSVNKEGMDSDSKDVIRFIDSFENVLDGYIKDSVNIDDSNKQSIDSLLNIIDEIIDNNKATSSIIESLKVIKEKLFTLKGEKVANNTSTASFSSVAVESFDIDWNDIFHLDDGAEPITLEQKQNYLDLYLSNRGLSREDMNIDTSNDDKWHITYEVKANQVYSCIVDATIDYKKILDEKLKNDNAYFMGDSLDYVEKSVLGDAVSYEVYRKIERRKLNDGENTDGKQIEAVKEKVVVDEFEINLSSIDSNDKKSLIMSMFQILQMLDEKGLKISDINANYVMEETTNGVKFTRFEEKEVKYVVGESLGVHKIDKKKILEDRVREQMMKDGISPSSDMIFNFGEEKDGKVECTVFEKVKDKDKKKGVSLSKNGDSSKNNTNGTGIGLSKNPSRDDNSDPYSVTSNPDTPNPNPDTPNPDIPEPINYDNNPTQRKIGLDMVLNKLVRGLDYERVSKSPMGKRYMASNIKVYQNFKNELNQGQYLYNIVHFVPNIIKTGMTWFRKVSSKILLTRNAKDICHEVENRLDNLSDSEIKILWNAYRGGRISSRVGYSFINPLIEKRLVRYGVEKLENMNNTLKVSYNNLFSIMDTIRATKDNLSNVSDPNTRSIILNNINDLYIDAKGLIETISKTRSFANILVDGCGIHSMEEDFKAAASKMNYVGMRFAKTSLTPEVSDKLAELEDAYLNAQNPVDFVDGFMAYEKFDYDQTKIENSIFGKRSVGSTYFSPLAERLDYRDDPFVSDLLTTAVVATSCVSAINSIRVHQIESQNLLNKKNNEVDNVNIQNDATMQNVRDTSQKIVDHQDDFSKGMKAQAHQNVQSARGTSEIADLDATNWSFSDQYHTLDAASHKMWNDMNTKINGDINGVATRVANGSLTQAGALKELSKIADYSQQQFNQVVQNGIKACENYAKNHPQFDLTGSIDSMKYIQANPNDIIGMNNAMVDSVNLASTLTNVQAVHMTKLAALPSDMYSTLIAAASAYLLVNHVAHEMKDNVRKKKYGNEITDMFDDYYYGLQDEEQTVHTM